MGDPSVDAALSVLGPLGAPDQPFGALTTYRVGGRAAVMATASSLEDLATVRRAVEASGLPVLVLGCGSNMLVADRGFPGIVVRLGGALLRSEVHDDVVRAGGGVKLPTLARRSVEAGLSGLEWAVGVPGSVGGGLKMNAGGHGSDVAATLVRFRVFDLAGQADGVEAREALRLSYRSSALTDSQVVLWGEFALSPGDVAQGRRTLSEIVRWRREHQPGGSNAGSVFVNPPGDSAGRLVEEAGLKGFRVDTAAVSTKHANFIQADDGGSATDVRAVMEHVRREVDARFGIRLRTEVRLVGFEEAPHPGVAYEVER